MKIIFILFIALFILTGFMVSNHKQEYQPSKGEQLVNRTLSTTAKIIKNKYNLDPCGSGAAMPGGPIQGLTLCFDTKFTHTKEQLRELLVKSAQELLNEVKKIMKFKSFLKSVLLK